MGFFDNLGKTISNAANTAGQKTKEVAETTKINIAISGKKNEIKDLYDEVGKAMCEEYPDAIPEALKEYIDKLAVLNADIAELQAKLLVVKNVAICASCGTENDLSAKFCANCGAKIEVVEAEVDIDAEDVFEIVEDKVEDAFDKVGDKVEGVIDAIEDAVDPEDK